MSTFFSPFGTRAKVGFAEPRSMPNPAKQPRPMFSPCKAVSPQRFGKFQAGTAGWMKGCFASPEGMALGLCTTSQRAMQSTGALPSPALASGQGLHFVPRAGVSPRPNQHPGTGKASAKRARGWKNFLFFSPQYLLNNEFSTFHQNPFFQFSQNNFVTHAQNRGEGEGGIEPSMGYWVPEEQIGQKNQKREKSENFSFFSEKRENFSKVSAFQQKSSARNGSKNSSFGTGRLSETQKQQQQVVSITYEEIGLFPRSFNRVFDRFFKQLFFDVENFVIQEYRFYRYLFLTTVKCLFILLFVPLSINFLAKNYFIRPITEYFWNTQNHEIFLNSYQQKRAFSEFQNFEEKIYFESFLFSENSNSFPSPLGIKKEFHFEKSVPTGEKEFSSLPSALHSPAGWAKPQGLGAGSGRGAGCEARGAGQGAGFYPAQHPGPAPALEPQQSDGLGGASPGMGAGWAKLYPLPFTKGDGLGDAPAQSALQGFYPSNAGALLRNAGAGALLCNAAPSPSPSPLVKGKGSPAPKPSPTLAQPTETEGWTKFQGMEKRGDQKKEKLIHTEIVGKNQEEVTLVRPARSMDFSTNFQNSLQKRLQTKIVELAKHYNEESIEAVTNFFADILSFATLWFLLVRLEIQINITKSFLLEVFFGLDDSKKSLLILFLTDLLVGYHSPNIWELFFQTLFDHYGLPESQTTIFLLVATLPVLLDVLFKYLIFRHLNRASPATVATYHAMIE